MSYSEDLKVIFYNTKLSELSSKQQSRIMNIFIIEAKIEELEWIGQTIGFVPAIKSRLHSLKEKLYILTNKYDSKTLYNDMLQKTKMGH